MKLKHLARMTLIASAVSIAGAAVAEAKTYFLKAERVEINVDDVDATGAPITTTIPMWGYALCATAFDPNSCGTATVPGPALTVRENQNLVVWLFNDLKTGPAGGGGPVTLDAGMTSFAVSGLRLRANNGPVFWRADDFDPPGDQPQPRRVRSMTHETPNGAWVRYRWQAPQGDLKPGTYIYHSATHPALQVQMGLYGPLTVTSRTRGEIYPGVTADATAEIFYSEIDANFHADVDSGLAGYNPKPGVGDPTPARTSPVDYTPTHFLVNGAVSSAAPFAPTLDDPLSGALLGGRIDQSTLVRFRSAALRTRIPMITSGGALSVVAETAEPYYFPQNQTATVAPRRHSAVLLPALTTADALIENGAEGANMIFDRALGANAAGSTDVTLALPDRLIVSNPNCNAANRLVVTVRTNSTHQDQQTISARVSNGTVADDFDIAALPFHSLRPNGQWQYRQVLSAAESVPFCPQAPNPPVEVTISAVSASGGTNNASKILP